VNLQHTARESRGYVIHTTLEYNASSFKQLRLKSFDLSLYYSYKVSCGSIFIWLYLRFALT